MINPKGKDEGKEWIELVNLSDKTIDISNWKIKTGKIEINIPENTNIKTNEYKIVENKNSQNKIIQSLKYEKSKEGKSLSNIKIFHENNQTLTDYKWTEVSKNKENPITIITNEKLSKIIHTQNIKMPKNANSHLIELILKSNKENQIAIQITNENKILEKIKIKNRAY